MSLSPNRELVDAHVRAMPGIVALPRVNGDLAFEAPWQSRAFGTAIAVVRTLDLDWDTFRQHLIAAVEHEPDRAYYDSWVIALEHLLIDQGLISDSDLDSITKPTER
jgi:nitrile hydratase accessory protein